jgi:hypothetical protein
MFIMESLGSGIKLIYKKGTYSEIAGMIPMISNITGIADSYKGAVLTLKGTTFLIANIAFAILHVPIAFYSPQGPYYTQCLRACKISIQEIKKGSNLLVKGCFQSIPVIGNMAYIYLLSSELKAKGKD